MQLEVSKTGIFLLLVVLFSASGAQAFVHSETHAEFRTPAKRQGGAYTVKLSIKRNIYEYTVPVWIRPDVAQSSLDKTMLKDLGWTFPDLKADEFRISNEELGHPDFKNAKSDWVNPPDFPRTCCYGVIGQDILQHYEVRFDPQDPPHLEWKVVVNPEKLDIPAELTRILAKLFSLHSETIQNEGRKIDLSDVPYVVNLSKQTFKWETPRDVLKKKLKIREKPIFSFSFTVPDRDVEIQALAPDVLKSAKIFGIHSGVRVLEFNWIGIGLWDKYEIQSLLEGKKMNVLPMKLEFRARTMNREALRKEVNFDFIKNEFVPK